MGENELYLNRDGLRDDISKMKAGLEEFLEGVQKINSGVDAAPNHWKGAAETEYMGQYQALRKTLQKDVPDAVEGMIKFVEDYLQQMIEIDHTHAAHLR